jgi:hypothetical protein
MTKTVQRFDYPEPQNRRIGIKVRWYYYASKEDALKASEIAKREAVVRADQGYDFGYQSPGTVYLQTQAGEYHNLYEVCLP